MRYVRNPITGSELEVPEIGDVFKKDDTGELFEVVDIQKQKDSKRVYILLHLDSGQEYGALIKALNNMHYIGKDV